MKAPIFEQPKFEPYELGNLCTKVTDGTHKTPKYQDSGVPFISTANIVPFRPFDFGSYRRFISQEEHLELTKRCKPERGDLLVSKIGTLGLTKLVDVDYEFSIFVGLALLKLKKGVVDAQYLEQLLNTETSVQQMISASPGSTRSTLTITAIKKLNLLLPSLEYQKCAANTLRAVDRVIEQTEALIAKRKRIRTGLMQDLLINGIDSNGDLRSEATHEYRDTSLGRYPKEWLVTPASSICEAVIDCKNRTPPVRPDGHPVIRTPNVRSGRFVYENLAYTDPHSYEIWTARGKPEPGDVVITREAPFGEACLIPNDVVEPCLGQRMMMYRPNLRLLDPTFLVYSLYSERVQRLLFELAGGSTVGHIRVGDIRSLSIPHPHDVEEQQRIADILNQSDKSVDKLSEMHDKMVALKRGLMSDLLSGKKLVSLLEQTNQARQLVGAAG